MYLKCQFISCIVLTAGRPRGCCRYSSLLPRGSSSLPPPGGYLTPG